MPQENPINGCIREGSRGSCEPISTDLAYISPLDKPPLGLIEADLMLRHIHPLIEQTYQRLVDRRNYARRIGDPFPYINKSPLGGNHPSVLLMGKANSLVARHIYLYRRTRIVERTIIAHDDFEVSISLAERVL